MSQPSREQLLSMLVGEGFSGGAKKATPKALKPWIAFRKKHPGMSIKQQSKLYRSKGSGMGEDEGDMEGGADDEYEYVIEGGKVKRRKKRKARKRRGKGVDEETVGGASSYPSDKWNTKIVKKHQATKQLGKDIYALMKKHFPKEWAKEKRLAGAGATEFDFAQFAKSEEGKKMFGKKLQESWEEKVVTLNEYESPRELAYLLLGKLATAKLTQENVYLIETGDEMGGPPPPQRPPRQQAQASASPG